MQWQWQWQRRSLWLCGIFTILTAGCGQPKHGANQTAALDPFASLTYTDPPGSECPAATAMRCAQVWQTIDDLKVQRDGALASKDESALAQIALQLDKQLETLELLRAGTIDPQPFADLDAKYIRLSALLGPESHHDIIYQQAEIAQVAKVFHDYGDLYIGETTATGGFEELSVARPWAGYWYPFRGSELFKDADSTLGKLDQVLTNLGRVGDTAAAERALANRPGADSWEGRCPAWAMASMLSAEPPTPLVYANVTFSIADLKGLLVLAHETYPASTYGIRYLGDASTDGMFQSLRPEAFHQLFIKELGEHHRAIIINDDAGIQVWQRPLYRMRWSVTKDPNVPAAYLVSALPYIISSRPTADDSATSDADRSAPLYEYRLYVDPAQVKDGKFRVIAGEWLNRAKTTHPHDVTIPAVNAPLGAENAAFNRAMDVVKLLVGKN